MNDRFDKIAPGLPAKVGLLLDAVFVFLALWLALQQPLQIMMWPILPLIMFSWFFSAAILRTYSPCTPRTEFDSLVLGVLGATGVVLTLATVRFLLGQPLEFMVLVDFGLMVLATTTLSRLARSRPFWRLREPKDRILIIGTGALGRATYERIGAVAEDAGRATLMRIGKNSKLRPVTVVGFLRLPGEPETVSWSDAPVLGNHDMLVDLLSSLPISEVYVAGRIMVHGEIMQQMVRTCEEVGAPFALPLHSLAFERATLLSISPASDGYLHYMNTRRSPMHFALKRLADITIAGTALLLLAPLLAAVAVAIKLTSRGPVLFRQARVGLHGATFNFLKFRSMVVNAEELREELIKENERRGTVFKMKYDPRITRIGRFIRKYSIDELPQLVNILRGDMAIVGPRPALPEEVATYKAWQRRRLSVRPGLTCFWQVHDKSEMNFDQWMRLDLQYVDDWNVGIDFMLIAQTVPVVLFGRSVSNEFFVWRGK